MNSYGKTVVFGGVGTAQSKLIWEIEDFERLAQPRMVSPCFNTIFESKETKWNFDLFVSAKDDNGKEWFGIYLYQTSKGDSCKVSIQYAILNINNQERYICNSKELSGQIFQNGLRGSIHATTFFIQKDILLKDQKQSLLNEGTLRIICTITTDNYEQVEKQNIENGIEGFLRFEESKHLLNLLLSGKFSDVVFSVEGRQICAHKSIIANRSPVFDAMFTHNTIEAKNSIIMVEDITYSTMHDLLKFIYSGTVPVYTEAEQYDGYKNLMIASNKYSISNLKRECERRLSNSLKIDNVFESLKFADVHDALRLKKNAIGFIACNGHEIIASPVYKEFGHLCPELASEVFRAVVKRMKTE